MIDVVGVGADGPAGLGPRERALIDAAEVVLGGERHLADVTGPAERIAWPSPLRPGLTDLLTRVQGRRVVALASGDPLVAGIGATLIELLGAERVRVHPAVSSVALARARMGWSAETSTVVRLRGGDLTPLRRELAPGVRVVVLSADETSPALVADALAAAGHGESEVTVLGRLGAADESRCAFVAADGAPTPLPRLNVVCAEVRGAGTAAAARTPGLPDDAYETDGQLTKRHVRATALAMLEPRPGELLWDLGAGTGTIGIEWARSHPDCRTVAVERNAERAARVRRNAATLGATGVHVVDADVDTALPDLPDPDAVFIGGGATASVIAACWARLRPGGRIVVHSVTLETQALLADCHRRHGGDLFEIAVRQAEPIGRYTGWSSARPVHQWVAWKERP